MISSENEEEEEEEEVEEQQQQPGGVRSKLATETRVYLSRTDSYQDLGPQGEESDKKSSVVANLKNSRTLVTSSVDMVNERTFTKVHIPRTSSVKKSHVRIDDKDPIVFGQQQDDAVPIVPEAPQPDRTVTKVPKTSKSLLRIIHRPDHDQNSQNRSAVDTYDSYKGKKLRASSIPPELRLNIRRHNTYIDRIRQKFPLPNEALPSTSLPEWRVMPLDNKIPYVPSPEGTMVFSRGSVGESISIKQKQFTLTDPKNYESKASTGYDSLHDPHAANYFKKPVVQQVLLKNGLINDRGQVVCSLKDFNTYRTCLRNAYNNNLNDALKEEDARLKHDLELKRNYFSYINQNDKDGLGFRANERRRQAAVSIKAQRKEFLLRMKAKQEREKKFSQCRTEDKVRQSMHLAVLSLTKSENVRARLQQLAKARKRRTEEIKSYIAAKEMATQERLCAERNAVLNAYKLFVTEWLVSKFQSQENRLQRDHLVRKTLVDDLDNRTLMREIRMARHRDMQDELYERRMVEAKRIQTLVRKYFRRWRDRVRQLRKLRPDEHHRSLWDITDSLRKTVDYLMEQSGASKLASLVFQLQYLRLAAVEEPPAETTQEEQGEADDEEMEGEGDDEYEGESEQSEGRKSRQSEGRKSEQSEGRKSEQSEGRKSEQSEGRKSMLKEGRESKQNEERKSTLKLEELEKTPPGIKPAKITELQWEAKKEAKQGKEQQMVKIEYPEPEDDPDHDIENDDEYLRQLDERNPEAARSKDLQAIKTILGLDGAADNKYKRKITDVASRQNSKSSFVPPPQQGSSKEFRSQYRSRKQPSRYTSKVDAKLSAKASVRLSESFQASERHRRGALKKVSDNSGKPSLAPLSREVSTSEENASKSSPIRKSTAGKSNDSKNSEPEAGAKNSD